MSVRRLAALFPLIAILLVASTLTSPAQAAATDPVTTLQVSQVQTPGHNDRWTVSATWDDNGAATYTASIVPNADGSGTPYVGPQDVNTNALTFAPTTNLVAGGTYYVAVFPKAAGSGAVTTTAFVAQDLDSTPPTATYTLNRTSGYLEYPDGDLFGTASAVFVVSQTSLTDSSGLPVTRSVSLGDGTAAKTWPSGSSFAMTYSGAGTFTPHVTLTDAYGNEANVVLPAVHVVKDVTGPVVRLRIPASSNLISSWRVVRGTATDNAVGVAAAVAVVAQKRGGVWYAYNFGKRTWVKGYSRLKKTLNRKAVPAFMAPTSAGAWHTPKIRGLRRGPLHVEALAIDGAFNLSNIAKVDRKIH